jgi:hypothetical protein
LLSSKSWMEILGREAVVEVRKSLPHAIEDSVYVANCIFEFINRFDVVKWLAVHLMQNLVEHLQFNSGKDVGAKVEVKYLVSRCWHSLPQTLVRQCLVFNRWLILKRIFFFVNCIVKSYVAW